MNVAGRSILHIIAVLALVGCVKIPTETIETRVVDVAAPPAPLDRQTIGNTEIEIRNLRTVDDDRLSFSAGLQQDLGALPAEGILELTLEQAVISTLARNRSLRVEQFQPISMNPVGKQIDAVLGLDFSIPSAE